MIIDFHTHLFPPAVSDQREDYLRRDPTFRQLYSGPRAAIATAEDLLRSMDDAGIDRSVALGFAWHDHDLCVRHNDYLLEAAVKSNGRIIPFPTINPALGDIAFQEAERCARAGAPGLGELRPENQGYDLSGEGGALLAALSRQLNLRLLFHVTEPVGHPYSGKQGLKLESFYHYALANPDLPLIGAHLGGGLPFFAHMPEVARVLRRVHLDTAGVPFLYDSSVYSSLCRDIGADRLLFGSDFPLITQQRQLDAVLNSPIEPQQRSSILGQNALALLADGPAA